MLPLMMHVGQCNVRSGSLASSQQTMLSHANTFHLSVSTISLLHNAAHSHELQLIQAFTLCLPPGSSI